MLRVLTTTYTHVHTHTHTHTQITAIKQAKGNLEMEWMCL